MERERFQPFHWHGIPRVGRRETSLLRDMAPWVGVTSHRGIIQAIQGRLGEALRAPFQVEFGLTRAMPSDELSSHLRGRLAVAVRVVRLDGQSCALIVDGALVAALAAKVIGTSELELPAPRQSTPAENGILQYLVATGLTVGGETPSHPG